MTEKDTPDVTPTPDAASTSSAPASDAVADKLAQFGADLDTVAKVKDLGVNSVEDLADLTEKDLTDAGLKVVQARKLLKDVKPAPAAVDTQLVGPASFDALPPVPDDSSWLAMLKTGGVLKVDQSTVVSTIRAALAQRVGLYDVPAKLVKAMEDFADINEEPLDDSFFKIRKQLIRRSYAEVFEAIDGLDGSFVTEARKKALFKRMDEHFWPALWSFNAQLKGWQETWLQGAANPSMMMMVLAGGAGGPLPPGMMQAPDTAGLRDAADAVADAVNKVFAGTGVPVASALAYDATQIRKILEDSRLPSFIGAANRDQMLKTLGVAVPATYPRLEVNLTRFVIAVMEVKNQPAGNEELAYFGSLFMLGNQIDWSQLGGGRGSKYSSLGGEI